MENKLIKAVQMYPCLFDKSKQEYRNKQKKEKSWSSVAFATGATVEHCHSRWRSLRDRYVRELVKAKSGAPEEEKNRWCYMDAMSFLKKHVTTRRTVSNMQYDSSEEQTSLETKVDILEEPPSSCSWNTPSMTSTYYFDECDNNFSTEEEILPHNINNLERRRKLQEHAHEKFDVLCGAVSELIAAKKESCEKSRNADFLKVLDSYLHKHSEDDQDRLKIQILNLVYPTN